MATVRVLDRSIPAPAYLAGIRLAKTKPHALFATSLWWRDPATGAEIIDQYRRDLHRRINRRGGLAMADSRTGPAVWAKMATPRVIIEPCDWNTLNRHHRPRLARRVRDLEC